MPKTREILDRLLALQELDMQIDTLQRTYTQIPEEIRKLQQEKARLQKDLEDLLHRKTSIEAEIQRLEREIQSLKTTIEEEKKKARRARTPRELEAIQKEIQYLTRLIQEKEDQILHRMDILEGKGEGGTALLEKLQSMENHVNTRIPEINARITVLEEDRRKLYESLLDYQEERERQIYFIEDRWLELYGRIRRLHGFPVLVEVLEGACRACGHVLSEDLLAELEERGIVQCEMCGRLIYTPDT